MAKAEQIINRLRPCRCGCGGKDPWHKSTYRRVVTKATETEGTVQLPMSTKPVRVTRESWFSELLNRPNYGAWIVDRSSIEFDKVM